MYEQLNDFAKMRDMQERTLAIMEQVDDCDHKNLAIMLFTLGVAHVTKGGDAHKARDYFERASSMFERASGPDDFQTKQCRGMLEVCGTPEVLRAMREKETLLRSKAARAAEAEALDNRKLRDWVRRWITGQREGMPDISDWNTSKVDDMAFLFAVKKDWMAGNPWYEGRSKYTWFYPWLPEAASSLNEVISGIGAWDTSSVRTMAGMFMGQASFNAPLGSWNVSDVRNMSEMFQGASAFNQPIGNWRVDKVTRMICMFREATSFNQQIGGWRVDKVRNMSHMFKGAKAFNQPLDMWRVDNVRDMCAMFNGAESFNRPIGNWRVDNVTDMSSMFLFATSFNQPIGSWNVSHVSDMSGMFFGFGMAFDQPLGDWKLRCDCNTERMFNLGDGASFNWFRNSRPVKESCCTIA